MKRETEAKETNDIYEADALIAAYRLQGKHTVKFMVYISEADKKTDTEALDLSPRAFRTLKRAGIKSVGELMEYVNTAQDLMKYRGLGTKSAAEIMYKLYLYQYRKLSSAERESYLKKVIEMNS